MLLQPTLLTDKSRLPEIYNFRVSAYEQSSSVAYINRSTYPHSWFDALDQEAYHWIVEDCQQIVASCRLCVLYNLQEIEEDFQQFDLSRGPYAFYSRLVVAKEFRGKGLGHKMDLVRMDFIRRQEINLIVAWARINRLPSLYRLGFKPLGPLRIRFGDEEEVVTALQLYRHNISNTDFY